MKSDKKTYVAPAVQVMECGTANALLDVSGKRHAYGKAVEYEWT